MYLSYRTEKWYNGEKLEGEDMKINEIFTVPEKMRLGDEKWLQQRFGI